MTSPLLLPWQRGGGRQNARESLGAGGRVEVSPGVALVRLDVQTSKALDGCPDLGGELTAFDQKFGERPIPAHGRARACVGELHWVDQTTLAREPGRESWVRVFATGLAWTPQLSTRGSRSAQFTVAQSLRTAAPAGTPD